jgi:hypothetical protein
MENSKEFSAVREAFLTRVEKDTFAEWKYAAEDRTILCNLLHPVFVRFASWIPSQVAPNVLSLLGLVSSILAWEWSVDAVLDRFTLLGIAGFLALSLICDKIDGIHARATLNSGPLGELIETWSVCLSITMFAATAANVCSMPEAQQYVLIILFNLVWMSNHLGAFTDPSLVMHVGQYSRTGPPIY